MLRSLLHRIAALVSATAFVAVPASGLAPEYYSGKSVLADAGLWIKVRVDSTGMQQFTYDELRAVGFSRPEAVGVYGYGAGVFARDEFSTSLPDDLTAQPVVHTPDGRLLFYGEASGRADLAQGGGALTYASNPYSFSAYYFLHELPQASGAAPHPTEAFDGGVSARADTHMSVAHIENEKINILGMGARWYDTPFEELGTCRYAFDTPDAVGGTEALVTYRWVMDDGGEQTLAVSTTPEMRMGGAATSSMPASSSIVGTVATAKAVMPDAVVPDRVTVNVTLTTPLDYHVTCVDWVALGYMRRNRLDSPQMRMVYADGGGDVNVAVECDGAFHVWDVTSSADVRVCEVASDGRFTHRAASSARHYVAFREEDEMLHPSVVGMVAPQSLHSIADVPDMVIITHPLFADLAAELADIHRTAQGMKVTVADAAEVYNEFGSGIPSATAIRRFVKMLYDRAPSRLRYVLLYGDGNVDNRRMNSDGPWLPTFQCDDDAYVGDVIQCYSSNAYFGMLADSYDPADMFRQTVSVAVGRVPADSRDACAAFNAKVRAATYSTAARLNAYTGLFAADYGDYGEHSLYSDQHVDAFAADRRALWHRVYTDVYAPRDGDHPEARAEFFGHMTRGVGLFNYVGHGNYHSLTSSQWLSSSHLCDHDYDNPPVAMLSTCLSAAYDMEGRCVADALLFNPRGGATAVIANTRMARSNYNRRFNANFIEAYNAAKYGQTIGDVWLAAITKTLGQQTATAPGSINTIKFDLLGDPAMALPLPDCTVRLTSGADMMVATPMRRTVVEGCVEEADGSLAAFDGTVEVALYAKSVEHRMLGQVEPNQKGNVVYADDVLLGRYTAAVTGGRFSVDVTLPALPEGSPVRAARAVVKAWSRASDDGGVARVALGGLPTVVIERDGMPDEPGRQAEISSLTIDGLSADAAVEVIAGTTPRIVAVIEPGDAGVDFSQISMCAPTSLTVDGRGVGAPRFIPGIDGRWMLDHTLDALADGHHTATLSVTDCAGRTVERTVSFTVIGSGATIDLEASAAIVRDEVTLSWSHTLSEAAGTPDLRLVVMSLTGETVLSQRLGADASGQWTWHPAEGAGAVAPGPYRCWIMGTNGRQYCSSRELRIVVLPQ